MDSKFDEPKIMPVALMAWELDHAPHNGGKHTAGNACTYKQTHECTFAVRYGNSLSTDLQLAPIVQVPNMPGQPAMAMVPLSGLPLFIWVNAIPKLQVTLKPIKHSKTQDRCWINDAYFEYKGQGQWVPADRPNRTPENLETSGITNFTPPYTLLFEDHGIFVISFVHFFPSPLRECMVAAVDVLKKGGKGDGEPADPDAVWQEPSTLLRAISDPPIEHGKLLFDPPKQVDLDGDDMLFDIKAWDRPRRVAVHWPDSNYPTKSPVPGSAEIYRPDPVEFLIFFHASFGQNGPIYGNGIYPSGWAYVEDGFHRYLRSADPLWYPFYLGIPYAVAVAGKAAVTVMFLNSLRVPELLNLNDGDQCQGILEEIQAYLLRSRGYYFWGPNLGRIGCGCFSAGYGQMEQFQSAANAHGYLEKMVQEYYVFDPKHDDGHTGDTNDLALHFATWAHAPVPADDKRRMRFYSSANPAHYRELVGSQKHADTVFCVDSEDGLRTACTVSNDAILAARRAVGYMPDWTLKEWNRFHFFFPHVFLTHALRKSGFK